MNNRPLATMLALLLGITVLAGTSWARGFGGFHGGGGFGGGGFRGGYGGGGFHGGYGGYGGYHGGYNGISGGYRPSNFNAFPSGGYSGFNASGGQFRNFMGGSQFSGLRDGGGYGDHFGGFDSFRSPSGGFDSFRNGGGFNSLDRSNIGNNTFGSNFGARPDRSELNSFLGLPSDEGMHRMHDNANTDGFNVQHGYAAGGAVEGPRGGEAGRGVAVGPNGGVAAGGAARGPGGAAAARGGVVGPEGRVAGGAVARGPNGGVAARGFAAGPHGFAAGFARVSPSARYATAAAVRGNFYGYGMFRPDWYRLHPGAWYANRWAFGTAWYAATWASLGPWFGYDNYAPIYYDYGANIVYDDSAVMMNGQNMGTPADYYQDATVIAGADAQTPPGKDDEWLSLGVYALTPPDQKQSNLVVQLAVNKQGVLRGNYTDTLTNSIQPIHGFVDKQTQRVAWEVGDNKSTVIETGLYNLTKDEAPALIHFGKDRTEQWLLVRLKDKDPTSDTIPQPQTSN